MKVEKILRLGLSCCRQLWQNLGYFHKIVVSRRFFENNNNRDFSRIFLYKNILPIKNKFFNFFVFFFFFFFFFPSIKQLGKFLGQNCFSCVNSTNVFANVLEKSAKFWILK